jgi:hypothetical protein
MRHVLPFLVGASAALLATPACSAAPSPAARDSAVPGAAGAATAASSGSTSGAAPSVPAPLRSDSSARRMPDPAQPSFTRLLTQRMSGFDEPVELVIRDRATLESAWSRVHNQVQGNPAPVVDFARETVILVALGRASSGGHDVRVDAIAPSGNGAVVRYTATRPGPDCMTTQALTSPVDVVRVPRTMGTVRFERRDAVQRC